MHALRDAIIRALNGRQEATDYFHIKGRFYSVSVREITPQQFTHAIQTPATPGKEQD